MVCSFTRFHVNFGTVYIMFVQLILASVKVVTFWKKAAPSINHMLFLYHVYLLF